MVEILIKLSSKGGKAFQKALDGAIKASHINPMMKTLNKFMKIVVDAIFKNPAVKTLSKGPLLVCSKAIQLLTKNPVYAAVQKAAKSFQKALNKKFCIMGKCFTASGILKKASGLMSKLMKPVMSIMNKILKPI